MFRESVAPCFHCLYTNSLYRHGGPSGKFVRTLRLMSVRVSGRDRGWDTRVSDRARTDVPDLPVLHARFSVAWASGRRLLSG